MLKIDDFSFGFSSSIDDFYSPPKSISLNTNRIKISKSADLSGFVRIASDRLVRISQNDFWKLAKDEDTGEFFIERLTDDIDGPVKG